MARPIRKTPRGQGGALEKAMRALQKANDGEALIKAIMTLVPSVVACDFHCVWLRIELHDAVGAVAYRIVDSRGRDHSADLVDGRFFEDHPTIPILMANPGIRFINTRETLPPDEILLPSKFYREVMRKIGFRHAVGMYFWDDPPRNPHEMTISPARREGQPDFTDEEVAALDRLYPHIDAALRRVRALDQERAVRAEMRRLIARPRPACVLHWDLTVAEVNRDGRETCARWNHGEASARLKPPPFRLPAPLRDACADLKRRWTASLPHRPATGAAGHLSVLHPGRPSLQAKVALHVRSVDPLGKPALLIEFEEPKRAASPAPRGDSRAASGSFTLRERELIRHVGEGKSNEQIASETGRALGTVKNALHVIFGKAGVRSRSALIVRMTKENGGSRKKIIP